jgi:ferredoxin-NADP reductase
MAVVRRIECVTREVIDHGEHVYTVILDPALAVPRFQPGQFLHLALDPYESDGHWPESRVFSIASAPTERHRLQITYAVKGSFTTRMQSELEPGRSVWVKLPYGDFVVDEERDAVLFAGGTGVTAFAAYLGSMDRDTTRCVQLYYGARTDELFVYRSLIEACEGEAPAFRCAYVNEAIHGRLSADRAWPNLTMMRTPVFYLSGPPPMLSALSTQLLRRGVPAHDIRVDAWE